MASHSKVSQHHRMACGESIGFARGGSVPSLKKSTPVGALKGVPMSPLTKVKMNNGVPGYKKGGTAKGCKCKGSCAC